jgi:predicted ATPase
MMVHESAATLGENGRLAESSPVRLFPAKGADMADLPTPQDVYRFIARLDDVDSANGADLLSRIPAAHDPAGAGRGPEVPAAKGEEPRSGTGPQKAGVAIRTPDQRLRVFVSSTLEELADARKAARDAIARLRLTPVMFELAARPHPPRRLYRAYVEQSDVFIGIYWQHYGWVAPGMGVSGLEEEYTLSAGKPRLIYIKAAAPQREQRLEALLQRIKADETASYKNFETEAELGELIANDLALLLTERFAAVRTEGGGPGPGPARSRGNLPVPRNPLLGREHEMAVARDLLMREDVSLLTVTGSGGSGKSRLALQLALELRDHFKDGAFMVSLAPTSSAGLVASAIARAVDVRETPGSRPLTDSLRDYLREKEMLLLLDNFEHLVAAAPLVADLLEASPRLKVMATSRTSLRLRGERVLLVPPLALPDLAHLPTPEDLMRYAAVNLFVQRASSIRADFALTEENAADVAAICVRLDGLPLAIELAAARIKVLPPRALLPRLEKRFEVLRGGARDLPERQQALRSAIDWSYDLLDARVKTLFGRLAAFAGGWTLEAAEEICNVDHDLGTDVLDGLDVLIDNSLITESEAAGEVPRFAMLETIHEYALMRWADAPSGEGNALRRRHADFFIALAERAEPHLTSGRRGPWLGQLEVEDDNLRAALAWTGATPGEHERELRLAAALGWFWYHGGRLREGRDWIEQALGRAETPPRTPVGAKGLYNSGGLTHALGDYAAARSRLEEAVSLCRDIGDRPGLAIALAYLGILELSQGKPKAARADLTESLGIFRESGTGWWQAFALWRLGDAVLGSGDAPATRSLYEESLAVFRSVGDPWGTAFALNSLGRLAAIEGRYAAARSLYGESKGLFRQVGDKWGRGTELFGEGFAALRQGAYEDAKALFDEHVCLWREIGNQAGVARSLMGFAALALASSQTRSSSATDEVRAREARRGAVLLAASDAQAKARDVRLLSWDQAEFDHWLATAHAQLDAAAFAAAWAVGVAMTLEQAVALAGDRERETAQPHRP